MVVKKKCVIFGCGQVGTAAYIKISEEYEVVAWSDNNEKLWGLDKEGIVIVSPNEINHKFTEEDICVIVAIGEYESVIKQLASMGLSNIMVWKTGLLYSLDKRGWLLPYTLENRYINDNNSNVLFVQTEACIRTHKIAKAVKAFGKKVYLAYLTRSPYQSNSEYADIYDGITPITSYEGLLDFVNNSNFEYVHSSNEPDLLSFVLSYSNKIVIHDCHDLSSAYKSMTPEELVIEYIANKKCSGVIYTTEGIRKQAIKKFNIPEDKVFVLENLISEELKPTSYLKKLSEYDGEIHCVYEGGVVPGDKEGHRYFEEIWAKIAQCGVHVHFYTTCDVNYCKYLETLHPYIHYEGNMSSMQLANEMTKYDVGLCVLNITQNNRQYAEFSSPNKIQEYINAGIPVAVGDITSHKDYVERNGFGKMLNMDESIYSQLVDISQIKIPENILHDKGLTLESKIPKLIKFIEDLKME